MKQDPKKMKKVNAMAKVAKAASEKKTPLPFWMKSKMGMGKKHMEPDADEKGGPSDMDMDDMPMKRGKK